MPIVESIISEIGAYQPIIIDGQAYTNWGQIAAYGIIIVTLYCFLRIVGKLVCR